MVCGERQQESVDKDDMLEVMDQTLAVEKVVRTEQKPPIKQIPSARNGMSNLANVQYTVIQNATNY